MLSHVAGPNNFLGQTEAKARYSLVQSLARIWLQQNKIHRSYLEELLGSTCYADAGLAGSRLSTQMCWRIASISA